MELDYTVEERLSHKEEVNSTIVELSKKIEVSNYFNLQNPDSILIKADLQQKHLTEIFNDPQVSAAMDLRKSQVQKLEWDVDRGVENDLITNFVRTIVKRWDLPKLINGIIDARAWGFTVFEYIWLQEEKFLKIIDVIQKPSYWFEFDKNSQLRFIPKNSTQVGIRCDGIKFLLVQNNASYENPYGQALLSKCYWQVKFKKDSIKLWAIFIEKYGMPHFIGKADKYTTDSVNSFLDMLDNLKQDGSAVVNKSDDVVKIAGNDTASSEIFKGFVDLMDKQISKIILSHSDAIDATQGQLGNTSKALTTLDAIAMSDKKLVEYSINQIIKLIVKINFGDIEHIPLFEMYEVADVDLPQAQRDEILTKSGVVFTKEYWLNSYGFKDTEIDIAVKTAPAGPAFSESETKINNIVNEMFSPFMDILDKGLDFEEVKKELYNKFNNISDAEVEAVMSKLMLQATKGV